MVWKRAKRIFIFFIAIVFFALGVVGLILPVVPQGIFFAISVILLSMLSPAIRTWIDKRTAKYPKFHAIYLKIDGWVRKVVGEV